MAAASDTDLLVLHGLRLKSLAAPAVIAELTGVPAGTVLDRLEAFAGKGWVRHREGVLTGWSLTPAGRVEGAGRLAEELASSGARPAVESAYRRFLALNQRFLQACTDWQLRPSGPGGRAEPNDHTDPVHDAAVIADLRALDAEVQPICADLADTFDRFGHYAGRFAAALARVTAGEHDWFTRPVLDSYHTVWFELHEDLLATLGIERSREGA